MTGDQGALSEPAATRGALALALLRVAAAGAERGGPERARAALAPGRSFEVRGDDDLQPALSMGERAGFVIAADSAWKANKRQKVIYEKGRG